MNVYGVLFVFRRALDLINRGLGFYWNHVSVKCKRFNFDAGRCKCRHISLPGWDTLLMTHLYLFSNVISHCIILEFIVNFFRMWNLKNPMTSILTVAPYFTENYTSTGLIFSRYKNYQWKILLKTKILPKNFLTLVVPHQTVALCLAYIRVQHFTIWNFVVKIHTRRCFSHCLFKLDWVLQWSM